MHAGNYARAMEAAKTRKVEEAFQREWKNADVTLRASVF